MSAEQNKAMVERINEEIWNKGNLDLIPQFISPEYVYHSPIVGDMKGHEGYKQYVTSNRAFFSDYHGTLTSIIAEGDMVATRLAYTGTNDGSIMGMPPTGKKVNMEIAVFILPIDGFTKISKSCVEKVSFAFEA